MQNFSDNLVTSPLIFNIFHCTKRTQFYLFIVPLSELVKYFFVSCVQQRVYQSRVHDVTELKQRLLDVWHGMEQGVIDSAIDEWRRRIFELVCGPNGTFRAKDVKISITCWIVTFPLASALKLCKICVILKSWICVSCGLFSDKLKLICYATFVSNSIPFPAVKEFWKSAEIWQSYRQISAEPFFETQCSRL